MARLTPLGSDCSPLSTSMWPMPLRLSFPVQATSNLVAHQAEPYNTWPTMAPTSQPPTQPRIRTGETLALAIPVGPISISAVCRIVGVIDEPNRYGFTFSTLPHHPEDGEESFVVTRHPNGMIDATVTAVWRPSTVANHLCPPLTRFLQDRTINQYLAGIATNGPWESGRR